MSLPEVHLELLVGDLYVYENGGSHAKRSPYSAKMIVTPHYTDLKGCIISGAFGHLSKNTNIMIGLKLLAAGYDRCYHKVVEGGKSTSHSRLVDTKDGYDYYMTDLVEERRRLLGLPDVT
jgi:hypothetical protein